MAEPLMTKSQYVATVRMALDSMPERQRGIVLDAAMNRYAELVAEGRVPNWELSRGDFD